MSNKASRTIIRDPRKTKRAVVVAMKKKASSTNNNDNDSHSLEVQQPPSHNVGHAGQLPRLFEPSSASQNQPSLGQSLGSYMLAGVGVAMGVTLVGALFGAIG
eukprot:CAMPEP_0172299690 /NCGR_PEP_ID=MMETSP1058-20130122/1936_1 /TAXON_ID=83371 /ORGANISM="Detonula confervacea, Strain CCMP 353" /LENGTH=102 /DNA_ID=CAMNT_0013009219 /DNA_START=176 /DNA_END=484 /DNA_ORIENTATION=+